MEQLEQYLMIAYLIAYPVYWAGMLWTLHTNKLLRLANYKTRFATLKEIGQLLFGVPTILWFIFLTIIF